MADRLASAREAVRRASDVSDDSTVREQLRSIDQGLREMTEASETTTDDVSTEGDVPHGEELRTVEEKIVGLADRADDEARAHLEDARDAIDDYRRSYARDW
jgi:hypothetical protein